MKLIVARIQGSNGIGFDGDLLIRSKTDLLLFRQYTLGRSVVMGSKTWESLGCKPLKLRTNYVVTSQKFCSEDPDVIFIKSLDEAPDDSIVIGGAQLYKAALQDPRLEEMKVTNFLYIQKSAKSLTDLQADTVLDLYHVPRSFELLDIRQYTDDEWSSPQIPKTISASNPLRFEVMTVKVK